MKIKEALRNLSREIVDDFLERDSNPEHIRIFSAHLPDCSRTKPLKKELITRGAIPGWGGAGGGGITIIKETIICPECKGEVVIKS